MLAQAKPQIWLPQTQHPWPLMTLAIRTPGDPSRVARLLRGELRRMEPTMALANVRTADEYFTDATARRRVSALLLGCLAALAVFLSAVGAYGVTAYTVRQRTQEFGLRIALGAERGHVLGMVVRQALSVAALGLLAGTAAALAATRLLSSVLYGVAPNDPLTFAAALALFGLVAVIASYLPARKATKVDPIVALRFE
jgi:putative ABC transport system permease protein